MTGMGVVLACLAVKSIGLDYNADAYGMPSSKECETVIQNALPKQKNMGAISLSEEDKEAITRVSFAEAGNQGASGLAGVVYTILNRQKSGAFGNSITEIVNSPKQFEPVEKVGGWINLPPATAEQRAAIDTIINLAADGRLPDLTNGALFFQNPKVVADRAISGEVSEKLVNFGGKQPSAVIKDHSFYTASIAPKVIKGSREKSNDDILSDEKAAAATDVILAIHEGKNVE